MTFLGYNSAIPTFATKPEGTSTVYINYGSTLSTTFTIISAITTYTGAGTADYCWVDFIVTH
jgi:hypothetical protein